MNTILYVENARGEREAVPVESTQGLSLFNANGQISDSSTGFKYATDTMSFIKAEITEQVFYEFPFADFVPTAVGRGSWADTIFTNVSFSNAGDFASGFQNTGLNTRFPGVDAAVSPIPQAIRTWAKQITWSVPEVQQALQANNWDPIRAKMTAIKQNYDLGIQAMAFLGLPGDTSITGLLTNPGVTVDTTTIPRLISSSTPSQFNTLVQAVIASYFIGLGTPDVGTSKTIMPTHLAIPFDDWFGLSVPFPGTVGTYPLPMIDYLLDAFRRQTRNPAFEIYPVAYCDTEVNPNGLHNYCLYQKDPKSVLFELPIGFTTTNANSLNNFSFQSVGYARVGSVGVFRPTTLRYFTF